MIYNNLVDKHIPFKYLVPGSHYKVPWLNDHIVKRAKAKRRKAKVLYCIMRPYTDGPIGPLSYRHSSGVVRNPQSALAE